MLYFLLLIFSWLWQYRYCEVKVLLSFQRLMLVIFSFFVLSSFGIENIGLMFILFGLQLVMVKLWKKVFGFRFSVSVFFRFISRVIEVLLESCEVLLVVIELFLVNVGFSEVRFLRVVFGWLQLLWLIILLSICFLLLVLFFIVQWVVIGMILLVNSLFVWVCVICCWFCRVQVFWVLWVMLQ